MGLHRNGARKFLEILAKACKLSHMPGFRTAINTILGSDVAANFYILWTPLCSLVEALVAADNWYNQRDTDDTDGAGEDTSVGI